MSRGIVVMFRGMVIWAMFTLTAMAADDLRVRLGEQGATVMVVRGIDAAGRVQLRLESGEGGEVLLPLEEAQGLQFELPEDYRKAQQLSFAGRNGEAVFLLRRVVPALVPFAAVPGSNATGIVRFYFKLLLSEKAWPEAIAVAAELPLGRGETDFVPAVIALARALQGAGRVADVGTVMAGVALTSELHRQLGTELANDLRRGGHWVEAQVLYEKLRKSGDARRDEWLQLLLAYTDWHLGSDLRAEAVLSEIPVPAVETEAGILYRLLEGRIALGLGRAGEALDKLAVALIGIESASEWRVELTAVIADAYRADGRDDLAEAIERDLRRLHPGSRWLSSISN
jgi:hypothetical protein